jgi:hypothetical protein
LLEGCREVGSFYFNSPINLHRKEITMKVIQRSVVKVVPGKMVEYMELEKERMPIATRLGMPPQRVYRLVSGEGDFFHTLIYELEWDSLAALEAYVEKMFTNPDPEIQALMAKYDALMENHTNEVYMPMP